MTPALQPKSVADQRVPVSWQDCAWSATVVVAPFFRQPRDWRVAGGDLGCAHRQHLGRGQPSRNLGFKFMKTSLLRGRRSPGAFTLIELLVVISIIAILAAMLLPALSRAKTQARKTQAKTEINNIILAIKEYESTYNGRFPVPSNIQAGGNDVTFGTNAVTAMTTNAAVIAILMDAEYYGNGQPTPNKDHVSNPQRHPFLNAKKDNDITLTSPGVGLDGEYRDPWGNPYVISMDLSYNDRCRDAFYSRASVSQDSGQTGLNGLFNPTAPGNSDEFEHNGPVMVWSFGPDKKADPAVKANLAPNKDNILSWQ